MQTDVDFPRRLERNDFPNPPRTAQSKLPVTLDNIRYLFRECEIELSYDVIKKSVSAARGTTALDESDLASLANLNGLGTGQFIDFVGTLARRSPSNPVADWIDSKPWDGVDRLPEFYGTVLVQSGFPEPVRDFILLRWGLACVAAAMEKDRFAGRGVLTFQGAQSIGKTRWLKRLVPEPLTNEWVKLDHHLDGNNKDSLFGAITHWIVEIGELDSSFRKDVGRLKGVLTRDCDKLRLPYARSPIELPRRTVFAATVNEWNFLVDPTGNTRWWTIPVEKLDHQHEIDMQQVFAQLAVRYREGEQWWLDDAEQQLLDALNSHHQAASVIEERIRERIDPSGKNPRSMTASKVLEEIGIRHPSNAQAKEAGAVLRSIYGPPKRVQGIMKWKVALLDADMAAWQATEQDQVY
jgi:predicted P-loop ATPase